MAEILPFRGIRYNSDKAGEMAHLVAPPYDVVDTSRRDALVARNPFNIFALELPKGGPGAPESGDKYTVSAGLFQDWMASEVLHMEEGPAIYPYDIDLTVQGVRYCRKGFIALLRIEDWASRIVRPHEQTFNKVTEDRLRLITATQAQFSQIFVLHRQNRQAASILSEARREDILSVTDEFGNTHRLWKISDDAALRALCAAFSEEILYIADGHHRYTTALNYRNEMRRLHGEAPARPYNYLMAYLVDAEDEGLVVLPTHRILKLPDGLAPEALALKAKESFEIQEVQVSGDAAETARVLAETLAAAEARPGIGVVLEKGRRAQVWWLKDGVEVAPGTDIPEVLQRLDVILLEERVIKGVLGLDPHKLEADMALRYSANGEEAVSGLGDGECLLFLRPTGVHQVLDVADAGLTMPHKSTYFYPKILSGLVLHSVRPDEQETRFD